MIIMFKASFIYLFICCFYHRFSNTIWNKFVFFSGPCCHSFPNPVFGQLTCSTSEVGNSQLIQYIFWWNFGNFPMKSIPIPRCLMYGIFSYIYRQNVGNRPYIEHLGLASMGRLGTFAGFMNVFGFFVTLRITFPPQKWRHFEDQKNTVQKYTGSWTLSNSNDRNSMVETTNEQINETRFKQNDHKQTPKMSVVFLMIYL